MKWVDWAFRDSTTGKASSTKILQVIVALGVVTLCIIWAVQGQLTFAKGQEFVLWLFGIQTTNNLGTRGIKAYANGAKSVVVTNNAELPTTEPTDATE